MESSTAPLMLNSTMSTKCYSQVITSKRLVKYTLIGNIIILLCISAAIAFFKYIDPLEPSYYYYEIILGDIYMIFIDLLLALAIIIFMTGLFGLIATVRNNLHLLKCYSVILVIITISNIIIGAILTQRSLEGSVGGYMILREYVDNYDTDDFAKKIIDHTQNDLQCCGVDGPTDWDGRYHEDGIYLHYVARNISLPKSCCVPSFDSCVEKFTKGCGDSIRVLLLQVTTLILMVSSPMSLLLFSCSVLTFVMINKLQRKALTQTLPDISIIPRSIPIRKPPTEHETTVDHMLRILDEPTNRTETH